MRDKDYIELMRDLVALRRSRPSTGDSVELDRFIHEHEEELRRRDHHAR